MTDELTRDEEIDALLDELEGAGIVERYVNASGEDAMRLTKTGSQLANQMSTMSEDARDDFAALLRGEAEGRAT